MDSICQIAEKHLETIREQKRIIEARMKKSPEGSIRFIKHGNSIQYYIKTNQKDQGWKYIKKSEKAMIKNFSQKYYDKRALKYLDREDSAIEAMLRELTSEDRNGLKCMYEKLPAEVQEIISPIDIPDEEYARQWLEIPFEGKKMQEENAIFQTNKGEFVRSKSELAIANALYRKGIPYKYECPLTLKSGLTVYPDFTVLNIRTREVYYWEHRGMMDNPEYAKMAVLKDKEYMKNHIFLGKNLILTEETLSSPLGTKEIEIVIREYLL